MTLSTTTSQDASAESLGPGQEAPQRALDFRRAQVVGLEPIGMQFNLDFARLHRDIVDRFGRFPYRNAVLGRASTPAELEFLKDGPRFGQ